MDDTVERSVRLALDGARRRQFLPGGVVGVVRPDEAADGTPWSAVLPFGVEDVGTGRAVDAATSFEIGSLTKLFTATVLASVMSEANAPFTLDSPVQQLARVRVPTEGPSAMTVGHLVTHRSGLPKMPGNAAHGPVGRAAYRPDEIWSALAVTRLLFPPGSSWLYSNFGFGLLGTVLAEQTGRPFGRLVDEVVSRPLGLVATGLEHPVEVGPAARQGFWRRWSQPSGTETAVEGVATGYASGSTAAYPQVAPRWDNTGAMAGSGGLVSNGADMTRFLAAAAGFASGPVAAAVGQTRHLVPAGEPEARLMGMAWQVRRRAGTAAMLFKNGGTSGMHCAMAVRPLGSGPHAGTGAVVLTNGPDHVDDLVVELIEIVAGA